MERRGLLKLSGVMGALAAVPFSMRLQSSQEISPFFSAEKMVPMNAANLCPTLKPAFEAQIRYAREINENVSLVNRIEFAKTKVTEARKKAANMLGLSDPHDLAFVRNTSEANSIVINGLSLNPGDEVLAWNENHPTNRDTWLYRRQRSPFEYSEVEIPRNLQTPEAVVERFVRKLTKRTRVVTFSHISNISGTRVPAEMLCKAVKDYNPDIYIHLDGAQSWGAIQVDLEAIDCDSYSSSGHKFLMGPRATGVLYVKRRRVEEVFPSTLGYDFSMEYPLEELPSDARRFECLGQRDLSAYAAIGDTIDVRDHLGGDSGIEAGMQQLTGHTLTSLDNAGIKLRTNRVQGMSHGVVIADMGGTLAAYGAFLALHNAGFATAFVNGARVCCEPTEKAINNDLPTYLRLSPHVFNSKEQIDSAVAVVKRINESKWEIVKEAIRFL